MSNISVILFILGILITISSLLVPNASMPMSALSFMSEEEWDYRTRNWWKAYLVMFIGIVVAICGTF